MPNFDPAILGLAVALGIGLLIGAERERRKGSGPERPPAGLRTFALAALVGAISFTLGGASLVAVAASGVFALTALAYWRATEDDPGLTTEIAVGATTLLGALAMTQPGFAAGVAVIVTILLSARAALHGFVRDGLSETEVEDALIFAAATLIVLPLLPDRQMGPFDALNPHAIWILVILVMAIGALGHIAIRWLGARFGLPIAGLASGFVSSVATIAAMGARAVATPEKLGPAAAGAILSTLATIVEMALLLAATNVATLRTLLVPLACAGAAAILYGALFAVRALRGDLGEGDERGRAFSISTAAAVAAVLGLFLLASRASSEWFGAAGVLAAAAVGGFADTHSAAISVATLAGAGRLSEAEAAIAILAALTTNTVTKLLASALVGGAQFTLRVAPGLILVILAAWAGWWLRV